MYSEKINTVKDFNNPFQSLGYWKLHGDTVTYTHFFDKSVETYTRHAIQIALNNVKNNRTSYETEKTWTDHIAHFEHGRSLFPVNWLTNPAPFDSND